MKQKQLRLDLYKGSLGGRRPGCGRKRIHSRGVAHRTRERVSNRTPLHINFKFRKRIRSKESLRLLKRAIMKSRAQGLRIIHYSLQKNHVHFIIEAESNISLTRGMRSLTICFAKGLKQGKVQIERYHLHVLRTLKETKNAIHYVLFNQQKHEKGTYSEIDNYSSILCLREASLLIKKFVKLKKMTIKIKERNEWIPDNPVSYLLKRSIIELTV